MTNKPVFWLVLPVLLTTLVFLPTKLFNSTPYNHQPPLSPAQIFSPLPLAQSNTDRLIPTPGSSVRFDQLSIEDGLSQNAGLAILQDRQGYLWFGTQDGLNRYDGYTFTIYKHDPNDANSLGYNSVIDLFEDNQGMLWIGTWGGGLDRFDPFTDQFTHYTNQPDDPNSLSQDLVSAVFQDFIRSSVDRNHERIRFA